MLLPQHKLDQLDFYTSRFKKQEWRNLDEIVLHWKQWWKPRTVITFDRICTKTRYDDNIRDTISSYAPAREFLELDEQLRTYFTK